jgi:hypothetical protein
MWIPDGDLALAWKMADRNASYLARALAARAGLWGNHGYEAAYPMTCTDEDGDQFDGDHAPVPARACRTGRHL